MALKLNNEDQNWVRHLIVDAEERMRQALQAHTDKVIVTLQPKGWKRVKSTLLEWAPLGGIFAVVIALIAILVTLGVFAANQFSAANSRLADQRSFEAKTTGRLDAIDKTLVDMRALVAASHATRKVNQDAAKELLAEARRKLIPPISAAIVGQAGGSFIEASSQDREAWRVALEFLNYRSSLTPSEPIYLGTTLTKAYGEKMNQFDSNTPAGKSSPVFIQSKQRVALSESVRLERIGQPTKQELPDGAAAMFLVGGAISLDGFYARGIVFEGVEVHYDGGPLILDGVFFVNCKFIIDNDPHGRALGEAILATSEVKFNV